MAQTGDQANNANVDNDSQPIALSGQRQRAPIRAYIENANDESIGGFTIPLPTTKEALKPWMDAIGAGKFHEESIAIREARSSIPELGDTLRGFSDGGFAFDELNYLVAKVSNLNDQQGELFVAAVVAGQHNGSVRDLINLVENIGLFELLPAYSEEMYGSFLMQMEKDNSIDIFEKLEKSTDTDERLFAQHILRLEACVDEAAYGRSVVREENGIFIEQGYLALRGEFQEKYRGLEDIPQEQRIFTHSTPVMDKEQFWKIIDDARDRAGRWQDMREPLLDALSKLEASDIIHWKQIFDEYQDLAYKDKLWAAAAVMHNGCSDDGFIDFRAWLTARGKDVYLKALANPDSLADVAVVQDFAREVCSSESTPLNGYEDRASFEALSYTPSDAYELKTDGANIYSSLYNQSLSAEETTSMLEEITYAEDIDAKWGGIDADWAAVDRELQRLLPRLYREFNKDEPQEKNSVLEKIREAKAAARANLPVQPQLQSKKSYEPEV